MNVYDFWSSAAQRGNQEVAAGGYNRMWHGDLDADIIQSTCSIVEYRNL